MGESLNSALVEDDREPLSPEQFHIWARNATLDELVPWLELVGLTVRDRPTDSNLTPAERMDAMRERIANGTMRFDRG